jgi:hypothetical protein
MSVTSKRPRTVIHHILRHGFITTEDLSEQYGYDHPPRAVRDVRENGIPLETYSVISKKTGRKIAAYRLVDQAEIVNGRVGGRKAFSKQFKERLIATYSAKSAITGEKLEPRYLQIDHRVPYEVAGNASGESVEDYMLLDASAQRAKSWSCEHCDNWRLLKKPEICRTCFWAWPEQYEHIAMRQERRLDVVWSGAETTQYDMLAGDVSRRKQTPQDLVKELVRRYLSGGK